MSKQTEGVFKKRVVADYKKTFGDHVDILVTQERGRVGVADLVICLFGDSVRQELKIDGEKPTKLQQYKLDQHTKAGGLSFYTTPKTWGVQLTSLKEKYAKRAT